MTWNNDMSAAPRDGTPVLLGWYHIWDAEKAHYENGEWGVLTPKMGFHVLPKPDAWQHLPEHPTPPQEPDNAE